MKPPTTVFTIVGTLLVLGVIGFGLLMWNFERPPFSLSRLQQLHPAMSTNDVKRVLGTPTSAWIRTNQAGEAFCEWAYSRRMSWPIVYIYFNPDGTFARHRYDP